MFTRIMELGFGEIVVVMAIVLLLFGPQKLPKLGEALGRGIRNFRDAASGKDADAYAEPPAQPHLPSASQASERAAAEPAGGSSADGVTTAR